MSTIALRRSNFSRWKYGTIERSSSSSSLWTICRSVRVSCASKGRQCAGEEKKLPNIILLRETVKFGEFVAREAQHDEEYRSAAWLRAECLWEDRENERDGDNERRRFAQQELNAMTRRYNPRLGQNCKCILMVKKEDNSIMDSVVGTLDLSIQLLSNGESYPGEWLKHPLLLCLVGRKPSICYAYIANLCVAKWARCMGVGSSMLQHAIFIAKSNGAQKVFVHVHRQNKPARNLYHKIGFQVVDAASSQLLVEQMYLLCLEITTY